MHVTLVHVRVRPEHLDAFIAELNTGPKWSRVTEVVVSAAPCTASARSIVARMFSGSAASLLPASSTPAVRSKSKIASCNWSSSTVRSETTNTVSNSFSWLALCKSARKCADHAIELVLPEPAKY